MFALAELTGPRPEEVVVGVEDAEMPVTAVGVGADVDFAVA